MSETPAHVLVVDDMEDIRDAISDILENIGIKTTTAASGLHALQLTNSEHFDLIISDILMPEIDGIELCNKIKALHPHIQFILISGGGRRNVSTMDYNYLDTARKLTGIDDVLKKPFDPAELVKLVQAKLQK